jgi:dolichol-phosphate mannosyltransferase
MPDISIIVPVYNEADNVLPLWREVQSALQKQPRSWELVFVDDCSTDDTWQRITEARAADPRVQGVRHLRNAGQSAAVWTGVRASDSPIIATLDGDLQNDPADIPAMLEHLAKHDFICGRRVNRRDTLLRRISSRVARAARKAVLKADFADTGCAMRVFKRSALEGILPFNGWHRFLPVLAHYNGASTMEVPVNHRARTAGVSKYGLGNRLWRGIYDLIGVTWYQKRRLKVVPTETLK